jgi:bile acid:Na+ symporter, BASS family
MQVVLVPVLTGIALNRFFPKAIARVAPFAPPVAVVMVALTCAVVMAQAASAVQQAGPLLLAAVAVLHLAGFGLGYLLSKALRLNEKTCRTNSIEVGMQNSTLGASLALLHFSDPLTAAPCAISACMHSMIGSLLAGFWRHVDEKSKQKAALGAETPA